jgi:hypothetical protein
MRLLVARCEMLYAGGLTATLPEATRLLLFKAEAPFSSTTTRVATSHSTGFGGSPAREDERDAEGSAADDPQDESVLQRGIAPKTLCEVVPSVCCSPLEPHRECVSTGRKARDAEA